MASPSDVSRDKTAPWYNVPFEPVMAVEHPCIVKNNIKGIEMLGGSRALSQTLEAGIDRTLALSFRPQEPSSRTIVSFHNKTTNVLLKVTVPKRTGRKRKRGTTDDFVEDSANFIKQNASYLVRSMSDNENRYTIEPVGNITSSHIYRNMPEFMYTAKGSSFLKQVETNILPQQYTLLKQFSLPRTYGLEDTEAVPPPTFSTQTLPHHYMYRQNPAVQSITNPVTGEVSMSNKTAALKTNTHQWQYDATIPTAPMPDCPPLEEQPEQLRALVKHLESLFEERPIWIRRALHNQIPDSFSIFMTRYALAYVASTARSGPWRGASIKFGVDPRTDPKYRKYQTILLQLQWKGEKKRIVNHDLSREWARNEDTDSHIFTGCKPIPKDGKIWQLCDLEDEQLKNLVGIPDLHLRPACDIRYFGWYPNGTIAKLRIGLKAKIDSLLDGQQLDPEKLAFLMNFPDDWDAGQGQSSSSSITPNEAYVPRGSGLQAIEWASAYRNMCSTPAGSIPTYGSMGKGRFSVSKPKSRPSYLGSDDHEVNAGVSAENRHNEDDDMNEDDNADGAEYAEPAEDEEDEDGGG